MVPGIGSFETALHELVLGSQRELVLLSYSLTSTELIEQLGARLYEGVRVRMVVDRLDGQQSREQLLSLAGRYESFELYDFVHNDVSSLHAKLAMADRREALLGSANLSWRGMTQNYEMAVRLRGNAVKQIARAVDSLLSRGPVRRVATC